MSNIAFVESVAFIAWKAKLSFCRYLRVVGNGNMCTMGFWYDVAKVLFRIRLVQNKASGASAIFQRHPKFCKTLRLFLYNLRLLKGCVYRLNGKTLLLSLLGRSRQRKCECKRCFGSNVAKVLLSIRLVQNKANGAKCNFPTTSKILQNVAFVFV